MTLWLGHWWAGWCFTVTCYGFGCDVWRELISVSPGLCISSLRNTSPSPSLVFAVWSGFIFDLPTWLMSSPGCKVRPRLTVSLNFTHFFHLKQLDYIKMYNTYLIRSKRCLLRSIFVSLCLDIHTSAQAPWQVSLGNQCSPEAMATGTRWEIRRWRSVGLTLQPGSAFLSLISTPTLIKPPDLMSLWSDDWLRNFGTSAAII